MESSNSADRPADATSRGLGRSSELHDKQLLHPAGVAKKTGLAALYILKVANAFISKGTDVQCKSCIMPHVLACCEQIESPNLLDGLYPVLPTFTAEAKQSDLFLVCFVLCAAICI